MTISGEDEKNRAMPFYVNHCCKPNASATLFAVLRNKKYYWISVLVAKEEIQKNDETTFVYGWRETAPEATDNITVCTCPYGSSIKHHYIEIFDDELGWDINIPLYPLFNLLVLVNIYHLAN